MHSFFYSRWAVDKSLFLFYDFLFLSMMSTTPAKISSMPIPNRSENVSPKIRTPMQTAVTGSSAPMMAEGVEPIRLIEIFMKKSESTVGSRANCTAQAHCMGV